MKQIEEEMLKNMHPVISKLQRSSLVLHLKDGELITDIKELGELIRNCRRMMAPVWPTEITLVEKTGKQQEALMTLMSNWLPGYNNCEIRVDGILIKTAVESDEKSDNT